MERFGNRGSTGRSRILVLLSLGVFLEMKLLHYHWPVRPHSSFYPQPSTPLALLRYVKGITHGGVCVSREPQSFPDYCIGKWKSHQIDPKTFLSETPSLCLLLTEQKPSLTGQGQAVVCESFGRVEQVPHLL